MEDITVADACVDEIALEGLDGITLNSLWVRLRTRPGLYLRVDDLVKQHLWNSIFHNKELSFYTLPKPRETIDMHCLYIDKLPVNIVKKNAKNLYGSCADFNKRVDITRTFRRTKRYEIYDNVIAKYGDSLVVVASQDLRTTAITGPCYSSELFTKDLSFALYFPVVERIARSRYFGCVTYGNYSLHKMFKLRSKDVFYTLKRLVALKLAISVEPFLFDIAKFRMINVLSIQIHQINVPVHVGKKARNHQSKGENEIRDTCYRLNRAIEEDCEDIVEKNGQKSVDQEEIDDRLFELCCEDQDMEDEWMIVENLDSVGEEDEEQLMEEEVIDEISDLYEENNWLEDITSDEEDEESCSSDESEDSDDDDYITNTSNYQFKYFQNERHAIVRKLHNAGSDGVDHFQLCRQIGIHDKLLRALMPILCEEGHARTEFENDGNSPVTDRSCKRLLMILDLLEEKRVLTAQTLTKHIKDTEKEEGYNYEIDKRCSSGLFDLLEELKLIKVYQTLLIRGNKKKTVKFLCHVDVQPNDSDLTATIRKERLQFIGTVKANKCPNKSRKRRRSVVSPQQEVPKMKKTDKKNDEKKNLHTENKTAGPKPPFSMPSQFRQVTKLKSVHELVFYLVHDYRGDTTKNKLYQAEPSCSGEMENRSTAEPTVQGLMDYLDDPIKRHYLVLDLPEEMRGDMFNSGKLRTALSEVMDKLCFLGLLSQGPRKAQDHSCLLDVCILFCPLWWLFVGYKHVDLWLCCCIDAGHSLRRISSRFLRTGRFVLVLGPFAVDRPEHTFRLQSYAKQTPKHRHSQWVISTINGCGQYVYDHIAALLRKYTTTIIDCVQFFNRTYNLAYIQMKSYKGVVRQRSAKYFSPHNVIRRMCFYMSGTKKRNLPLYNKKKFYAAVKRKGVAIRGQQRRIRQVRVDYGKADFSTEEWTLSALCLSLNANSKYEQLLNIYRSFPDEVVTDVPSRLRSDDIITIMFDVVLRREQMTLTNHDYSPDVGKMPICIPDEDCDDDINDNELKRKCLKIVDTVQQSLPDLLASEPNTRTINRIVLLALRKARLISLGNCDLRSLNTKVQELRLKFSDVYVYLDKSKLSYDQARSSLHSRRKLKLALENVAKVFPLDTTGQHCLTNSTVVKLFEKISKLGYSGIKLSEAQTLMHECSKNEEALKLLLKKKMIVIAGLNVPRFVSRKCIKPWGVHTFHDFHSTAAENSFVKTQKTPVDNDENDDSRKKEHPNYLSTFQIMVGNNSSTDNNEADFTHQPHEHFVSAPTAWLRLKSIFLKNEYGFDSFEWKAVKNSTLFTFIIGTMMAGTAELPLAHQRFKEQHSLSLFANKYEAIRRLQSHLFVSFWKSGIRLGLRIGFFTFSYT
ncbi:conserved hypothetical protein [Trichinella spiralis]|uniref:hypothetical protein n=1 Tax=Trichinella spiralis TaxID=6334 RepID=UPI0001EFCFA8|nr:conserved hypothetical protein [Trichinella spiralis]